MYSGGLGYVFRVRNQKRTYFDVIVRQGSTLSLAYAQVLIKGSTLIDCVLNRKLSRRIQTA